MSDLTAAELVERVREALDFKPHWHTQAEKKQVALAALSELEERLETAEWAMVEHMKMRQAAEARVRELEEAHDRVLTLAEHLWQMVPQEVWREHGGDDGQGHYEGDYHAEGVREKLRLARAALTASGKEEG